MCSATATTTTTTTTPVAINNYNNNLSNTNTINRQPRNNNIMLVDSLKMIYEFENGVDVIDSLLHPESLSGKTITLDQRDGLNQLRKVLLLATASPAEGNIKINTHTVDLRRSFLESLENEDEKESDNATNQYLLFEFGGIKSVPENMKSRWQLMKKAVKENNSLRRIKKMISNRKIGSGGSTGSGRSMLISNHLRSNDAPAEWYSLDRDAQIELATNHLSWEKLMKWDFDMFEVSKLSNGRPLLFVGWAILASPHSQYIMEQTLSEGGKKGGSINNDNISSADRKGYKFLDIYKIPPKCMIDFLRGIEDRYVQDNPYHNNIHAADVLQTTHSFLEEMGGKYLDNNMKKESSASSTMTLQMFSILVGAAIHDVGHPGYNNAFQSNSFSQTALTYNDNSVLENFHTSLAFQMILGDNGNSDWNIFQNMEPNDFMKCKRLITEAILGTDLTFHFSNLEGVKNLVPSASRRDNDNDDNEDDYSWKVMSFLMHMADISNLGKRRAISTQWTDRVLLEFFRQGDKEKELGLPISPLCNRDTTSRPDSQIGFINYIIRPSFEILKDHLPLLGTVVLPLVEGNFHFWQLELEVENYNNSFSSSEEASSEEEEKEEVVNINIVTSSAA